MLRFILPFALMATPVEAQLLEDAAAPSLAVAADRPPPSYTIALGADALGAVFGEYALRFELVVSGHHGFYVGPSWRGRDEAFGLEVGYHLWAFGEGVEGLYVGVGVGLVGAAEPVLSGVAEAGYQWVWSGITVGVGAGAAWLEPLGERGRGGLSPRVVLSLGCAWL